MEPCFFINPHALDSACMPKRKTYPDDIERLDSDDPSLKPWHRRPAEPPKAYAVFKTYCKLGAGRSLILLAHRLGCSLNNVKKWSVRWDWVERSRHWDSRMAEAEQEAQERVRAEESAKWERRRMEAAEANWDRAQRVAVKAEEMLKGNLYEQSLDKDGKTVVIQPAKWTMATAGALLKLAAELQAAALGEAMGEADDGFDPAKASPEECRAYLAREGILKALPAPAKRGD